MEVGLAEVSGFWCLFARLAGAAKLEVMAFEIASERTLAISLTIDLAMSDISSLVGLDSFSESEMGSSLIFLVSLLDMASVGI